MRGRCRSFYDGLLDMVIDNGNHLVLSGNAAVTRYMRKIGAADRLTGPGRPEFHFLDRKRDRRWVFRPDEGRFPGGSSMQDAGCRGRPFGITCRFWP